MSKVTELTMEQNNVKKAIWVGDQVEFSGELDEQLDNMSSHRDDYFWGWRYKINSNEIIEIIKYLKNNIDKASRYAENDWYRAIWAFEKAKEIKTKIPKYIGTFTQ